MKWYNRTWVVVLFCIFVPPVGLVFLWVHPTWTQKAKIVWTLIVGFASLEGARRFW